MIVKHRDSCLVLTCVCGACRVCSSIHTSSLERSYCGQESEELDYRLELDTYRPVQPLSHDHGVSFFPLAAPRTGIDHHVLQVGISPLLQP